MTKRRAIEEAFNQLKHIYIPLYTEKTIIKCEIEWENGKARIPYGMPPTIHDEGFDITHVFNEETQEFEEFTG